MGRIKLAIAGVGNCASALLQGIEYYRGDASSESAGLLNADLGGYRLSDVEVVAAFDVDRRKVGQPLEKAVFAAPNCTTVFHRELPAYGVTVQMSPVLDGVPAHMRNYPDERAFRVAEEKPCDVVRVLRESGAEVLVCYLPVGSEDAVQHYAQACLDTGVALVNCVPVFIASNPEWAEQYRTRNVPVIGDDIKSQVGATITHRVLTRLFEDRGVRIDRTYQLNFGGNTDFLNMLERERLESKKISKTNAVTSMMDHEVAAEDIHVGPSDHVPWLKDRKWCHIRIEGTTFGNVPLSMELKLEVWDSPNSAGVITDAIRCLKLGLDRGLSGTLVAPSAYFMKSPPQQLHDDVARERLEAFIRGEDNESLDGTESLPARTSKSAKRARSSKRAKAPASTA